ncbi:hypothetical protein SAMN02744784_03020 [Stenotrophomonas sp. CC120223-11]|nr:hypothetical protein SAMN02744784_03020 [Stenotrophomonas sp. CC120223-11]
MLDYKKQPSMGSATGRVPSARPTRLDGEPTAPYRRNP